MMRKTLKNYYLDYINNFLTVEEFAGYYNISEKQALAVICLGREIHIEDTEIQAALGF